MQLISDVVCYARACLYLKQIILLSETSRLAVWPTHPVYWVPRVLSSGVKWPGREADHSPPYSAEVKNEWSAVSAFMEFIQTSPFLNWMWEWLGAIREYETKLNYTPLLSCITCYKATLPWGVWGTVSILRRRVNITWNSLPLINIRKSLR
jgi:hypothetical protein